MVEIKSIRKMLAINSSLLIAVLLLPYIIPKIYPEIPYVEILAISAILLTMIIVNYTIMLILLSSTIKKMISPAEVLAEKMMKCKLRAKNGFDYCVKCPDSYTCAVIRN